MTMKMWMKNSEQHCISRADSSMRFCRACLRSMNTASSSDRHVGDLPTGSCRSLVCCRAVVPERGAAVDTKANLELCAVLSIYLEFLFKRNVVRFDLPQRQLRGCCCCWCHRSKSHNARPRAQRSQSARRGSSFAVRVTARRQRYCQSTTCACSRRRGRCCFPRHFKPWQYCASSSADLHGRRSSTLSNRLHRQRIARTPGVEHRRRFMLG